ncbi:MAG: Gfo/Idh/MocA family oxidoreductase [Phycisphaerales bacterium]|nr:Gfo/Idh/MocA family oxidoreductase [Phycisphaerales bacterium]
MSSNRPIGVGVIGLGFMGQTHLRCYRAADKAGHANRLVAVCDSSAERRAGRIEAAGNIATGGGVAFDAASVSAYASAAELLADPAVDLVSICTHTDTHADLAIAALEAGKHVLVEKPVAIASAQVQRVADAALRSERLCMPGLCIRFWPAWAWLRERIVDGAFGSVRSATFHRLASPPGWASAFYTDDSRTGGALVDLHIHDADFVRWVFGDPQAVVSAGTLDHVTTIYRYGADGPSHVVAEGGWDHTHGFEFRMRYVVLFEHATADFDLGRNPQLLIARNGQRQAVELDAITGYDAEIRHLLDAIATGRRELNATIDDAVAAARLLEAERESLRTERRVELR